MSGEVVARRRFINARNKGKVRSHQARKRTHVSAAWSRIHNALDTATRLHDYAS